MMRLILIFILFTFIPSLYSWSPSHKRFLKELDDYVPFLKDKLSSAHRKKLVDEYYNLPDQQIKLDSTIISEASVEYLKTVNIYNSYSLHQPEALPHMFYLLVESLKRRTYAESIVWIASISHNINDSASPHFIPGVYAFEQMRRNFNVSVKGKKVIDMNNPGLFVEPILNRPEGIKLLQKLKKEYKFKSLGKEPEKVSTGLVKLPFYLRNVSFKHAEYLLANYERNVFSDDPQIYNGNLAIAKMAAIGITSTADVLNTAWEIADSRTRYRADEINVEEINKSIDEMIKARKLEHMPIFQKVLPGAKGGKIGILTEPFYKLDASLLGYASRILAASIMGTLKKDGKSYRVINLLDVIDEKLPSAEEMPILIIPACDVTTGYRWIKKRKITNLLRDYTADGGKVLWISSSRIPHLGELSFSMKELSDKTELEKEVIAESTLYAVQEIGLEGKKEKFEGKDVTAFTFKTIPGFEMQSLKILSPLYVNNDTAVEPLLYYKTDSGNYIVGAYEADKEKKGKAKFICISTMFFFPGLFSSEYPSADMPQLDSETSKMLTAFLKLLE